MTILKEEGNKIYLTTKATLLNDERDIASWATKYVVDNPEIKWVLGKYVEADNANSNGQYWSYDDLRLSQPTIHHTPMNIDHAAKNIVGTWVNSEMIMPTAEDSAINPYIETLGAFWKYYFPNTLKEVEAAYESGNLFISMECVAKNVTCGGDNGCGQSFAYQGPQGNYCDHIKERSSYRQLENPTFLAGALIMPGNRPGWKSAYVKEISELNADDQERLYVEVATHYPELAEAQKEDLMRYIMMQGIMQAYKK